MATQKGTHITKFDNEPFDVVDSREHGGVVKYAGDAFELVDTANGDNAMVVKVPIDAVLQSVKFGCDDLGTAGTVSIGFYKLDTDGTYTAVDADALAVDIDVATAAISPTEYRFEVQGIETANESAWELANLTERPEYTDIYIGLTTATGTTATGTVLLQVLYTE